MGKWCTVTVTDAEGRRRSIDVFAESSYDAAHIYLTQAKASRAACLPIPNRETEFEVVTGGRVYRVLGSKLRDWIANERLVRKGPYGYMFAKRAVMD